jgi:hypothetical protein
MRTSFVYHKILSKSFLFLIDKDVRQATAEDVQNHS